MLYSIFFASSIIANSYSKMILTEPRGYLRAAGRALFQENCAHVY